MRKFLLYIVANILLLPIHLFSMMMLVFTTDSGKLGFSLEAIFTIIFIGSTLALISIIPSTISLFIIKFLNKGDKRSWKRNKDVYYGIGKFIFSFYIIASFAIHL